MQQQIIKLQNVRLSYPSLFQPAKFNGNPTKYEATLLIEKTDTKNTEIIMQAVKTAISESGLKIPKEYVCFKEGDDVNYIKASNKKRPTVVNRDKSPITEDDGIIYGGCYVNASITLWVQNNNYGKRVNANLRAIQFVKDGESFGVGSLDASNDFDALDDTNDENYF